jgi:hypothetical protein
VLWQQVDRRDLNKLAAVLSSAVADGSGLADLDSHVGATKSVPKFR